MSSCNPFDTVGRIRAQRRARNNARYNCYDILKSGYKPEHNPWTEVDFERPPPEEFIWRSNETYNDPLPEDD